MSTTPALWATASKEWVIQPKPKPGRKPKKDPAPAKADTEPLHSVDDKGRRVQNRAAQRAFRERKQSQLAELQAKVQQYEQGEIERNVALQNIAKKLKAENDALRQENASLLKKLEAAQAGELSSTSKHTVRKKRGRDDSIPPANIDKPLSKKLKTSTPDDLRSVSPSVAPSPDASETGHSSFDTPSPGETTFPTIADNSPPEASIQGRWNALDCGLCSVNTPCACRELGLRSDEDDSLKLIKATWDQPSSSILDNLPAFQPAVPLRRRVNHAPPKSLFPVKPIGEISDSAATCSGDPANCPACADDSFGQAFCAELAEKSRCEDCPQEEGSSAAQSSPTENCAPGPSTVPTNDAWRQFKSHPNVSFADLSMLADVVARKSKCTGPTVTLSPPPEEVPLPPAPQVPERTLLAQDKPSLAPQELLMNCSQRRIRTVDAACVQDALRLLDSKFSRTWE